ncbi:carbon-nitrogen hydrolase family protein [Pseudomonas capeferrum]|uniref:carbon-nitrogen hydrolase family protein n=1 Tax=Pseudomonas capeferrum TaxID=1495066 RepID=UPI0015E43957|nr:carbon-nitrogen hydrolase family protein [Pseudomonas capeferrum]MBA1202652.1 carbon-nitrogen hydrolase family protein [Pseudomonas capeferrum]
MKSCAVQLASIKGDLAANLSRHLLAARQALERDAELVCFPELSLTGYEPRLARQLALSPDTPLLQPLQALCDISHASICVGLPLSIAGGVRIGMMILRPHSPRLIYTKRRLHEDEVAWFTAGEQPLIFAAGSHRVAPAICYESMFLEHAEEARGLGADLYMVSVAKTAKGIQEGFKHYPEVARRLNLPVLMANCTGPADDFIGAGRSAAWDHRGRLVAELDHQQQGLLMFDSRQGSAETFMLTGMAA